VLSLIDKVTDLHRIGALDTLFDTLTLLHAARSALTDNMVERLFVFVEHMINNMATEEVAVMAHNARVAMDEAVDELRSHPSPGGGILSTVRMLGNPQSQKALQFLLAFACKLQALSVGEEEKK
jgi:uncharacterized protein YjgD (DUF1641 family)